MKRYSSKQIFVMCLGLCIIQATWSAEIVSSTQPVWSPLSRDELHDPANPAINLLQNPASALSLMPRDGAGDQVNWVKALDGNYIKPRITLHSNTQIEVLDLDVLFRNTGEMGMVNFPHKQHTQWLSCNNCHEKIFKSKSGANRFGMFDILNGQSCGRCHGAVAFPLTECNRCHNAARQSTDASRNPIK
ncbi:MAG: c(7)-type cytochrome triheme domain-containing protein [Gallionella sp.]|jgi:c(7)-type cytochrome triheme protein